MTIAGTAEIPLRVAIIGAGPSGFYAAEQILKANEHARVDLFDRLPTPYGLVRGGVAPDHPKIKSVTRVFEKTAGKTGFRFFGNVELGRDLHVADLERHYHAIIYTFGAEADRELGIPGEDLPGSYAATAFVGWYNGHPDFAQRDFRLNEAKRVVVIGNGNVAIDVARMLALTTEELSRTDTADHAIEALRESTIEEIVILGRRGPVQAAFTNPEIREIGELEQADVIVDPSEMDLDPVSKAFLESDAADKTAVKNAEILREFASRQPDGKPKRVVLRFLSSPVEIRGGDQVESIVIGRNRLVDGENGLRAEDTGEREEIECQLVLRSVGYTGVRLEGVPFDDRRGLILNLDGRVLEQPDGPHKTGHYTAGWIKRGPSGVIGTNKKCAQETVNHLIEDVETGNLLQPEAPEPEAIENLMRERGVHFVPFSGWQKIDEEEINRGEPHGRPRVKFVDIDEMLDKAGTQRSTAGTPR